MKNKESLNVSDSQRDKMKIDFAHGIAKAAIITKICSGYNANTKPARKSRTQVRSYIYSCTYGNLNWDT